jgi:hypothetical protein
MFGQVQRKLLTNRVISHSPKWVSCDGIDLADGDVFATLGTAVRAGLRWDRAAPKLVFVAYPSDEPTSSTSRVFEALSG